MVWCDLFCGLVRRRNDLSQELVTQPVMNNSKEERQNPNLFLTKRRRDSVTPRVSVVIE
jgi:hypothetical protein